MAETGQSTVFDTGQQYLGSVYAKALLGAGQKSGNAEQLLNELEGVVELVRELPSLGVTLEAPRVPLEAKERLLDNALGGKVATQLLHFLKVLARRGRTDCLRAIAVSARQQFNLLHDRVEVQVQSAEPLDDEAVAEVTAKLQERLGKQVDLKLAVDPELIAGLVVRVGDTVYDGSLANRLTRMRETMVGKTTQQISAGVERFAATE